MTRWSRSSFRAPPAPATVRLNGTDVSDQFALRANGRYMGLLTGLKHGENTLTAALNGTDISGSAKLVNYPTRGPIFPARASRRYACEEGAVDVHCNKPAQYTCCYKSTNPTTIGLQPYDPASPPTDIAQATTDDGVSMPFIVRQELGYQDRDQYKILTLFTPDQPWSAWNRSRSGTTSCWSPTAAIAAPTTAPVMRPRTTTPAPSPATPLFEQSYIRALGRGFMVMTTALDNTGHNCDVGAGR